MYLESQIFKTQIVSRPRVNFVKALLMFLFLMEGAVDICAPVENVLLGWCVARDGSGTP